MFVILISGCSNDALEKENASLKIRIEKADLKYSKEKANREAEIEYANQQASIAVGCDWLFPSCPEKSVSTGRKFLEKGYGGASWPMWILLLLKFSGIYVLIGITYIIFAWGWIRIIRPDIDLVKSANKSIADAENIVAEIKSLTNSYLLAQETAQLAERKAIARMKEAERAAAAAEAVAAEAVEATARATNSRSALNAFDL